MGTWLIVETVKRETFNESTSFGLRWNIAPNMPSPYNSGGDGTHRPSTTKTVFP